MEQAEVSDQKVDSDKEKKKKRAKSTDAKSKDRRNRQLLQQNFIADNYNGNFQQVDNVGYYNDGAQFGAQYGADIGVFQRLKSSSVSNDLSILKPPGAYEPSTYKPIGEPIVPGSIAVGPGAIVEPMVTLGPRPDLAIYKSALDEIGTGASVQTINAEVEAVAEPVQVSAPQPVPVQVQPQVFSRFEQVPYQPEYQYSSYPVAQPSFSYDQSFGQIQNIPTQQYYGSVVEQPLYSQGYSGVGYAQPQYNQVYQQGYAGTNYVDRYQNDIREIDEYSEFSEVDTPYYQSAQPQAFQRRQDYNFDIPAGLPPGSRIIKEYIVGYVDGKKKKEPEPVVIPEPVANPEPVVVLEPEIKHEPAVVAVKQEKVPEPVKEPVAQPIPDFSSIRNEIINTIQ